MTLGLFGERNYFALHFGALLWTLATMALLATIVRRLVDVRTGCVAAGLYAVFSAWANYTNLAFNGELLMNLPVVAAFAIAMRFRPRACAPSCCSPARSSASRS